MDITRRSPWSKRTVTMRLDVSDEEFVAWRNGKLIQEAMPRLNSAELEFIKTGLTPGDWLDMFKEELEDY